jgi:RimJ/RimL family protein N-acetyltransferase
MPPVLHTPKGDVDIRPACMDDMPAFRPLRLQALRDHPKAFSADYERHAAGDEEFWKPYFNFGENATIHFALQGYNLIGMTGVRLDTSPKTKHNANIWGVYILPEWRGHGIALALVNTCCDWARERGALIARLGVTTTNQPALRCYESCGFKITGTDPQAIFVNDRYYDEYLMSRVL